MVDAEKYYDFDLELEAAVEVGPEHGLRVAFDSSKLDFGC